jgi:probable rRNA maturation factor
MPRFSIAFTNRQHILSVDRRRLARLARSVLAREQVVQAEISVAILDDPQIHALNREFLHHDFPTDVISFLLDGGAACGKTIDGEIVISAETARRAAGDHGTAPEFELALYLVHGLLHLCGYDDRTPHEERRMRRREAQALREWKDPPPRRRLQLLKKITTASGRRKPAG